MNGFDDARLDQARRAIAALGNGLTAELLDATTAIYAPLHDAERPGDVRITRDISYGPHERHRLDIFQPVGAGGRRTAIVFVHGGGFVGGDKSKPGSPFFDNIGDWSVRHGFAGVNMTYRLAPGAPWPAGADDVAAAADWLAGQAGALGIDRLLLLGQSAGAAHVAMALALHEERLKTAGVCGAVLLSGVYDLTIANPKAVSAAYYGADPALFAERSSQARLLACRIPWLVAVAEHDPGHFQRQALGLIEAAFAAHGRLPPLLQLLGHNHLSGILHLGLPRDQLGPAVAEFAAAAAGAPAA